MELQLESLDLYLEEVPENIKLRAETRINETLKELNEVGTYLCMSREKKTNLKDLSLDEA